MAVKINDRLVPEAHEVNDRIKYLLDKNGGIKVYDTFNDFPQIGFSNLLYRAEDTDIIYYWSSSKKGYEPIGVSSEIPQIQVIHGGTSKGITIK